MTTVPEVQASVPTAETVPVEPAGRRRDPLNGRLVLRESFGSQHFC